MFESRLKTPVVAATILLSSLFMQPVFAVDLNEHRVESLAYGEALFHYFQRQDLQAINRILVDEFRGNPGQQGYSKLLLADLYYRYGLLEDSQQLFAELLEETQAVPLLNRIWFNLARLSHGQALYDDAEELLLLIDGSLPYSFEQERQAILSSLALNKGDFIPALEFTDKIDTDSDWSRFSFYNIAVELLENERASQGEQLLEYIIDLDVNTETQAALRDRALLSLAIKQIGSERYESALEHLQSIRLNGPLSDRAILATGWLHQKQDSLDKAINTWRFLIQRNRLNAETREAVLAIPMSQEEAGELRAALQSYQRANSRFDQQQAVLRRASSAIDNDQLLPTIKTRIEESSEQPVIDQSSAELAEMLYVLLASAPFQNELNRLQELFEIRDQMVDWQRDLPTLVLMLEERRTRFALKLPLLEENLDEELAADLQNRLASFKSTVQNIESVADHSALLSDLEQEQAERLQGIDESIRLIDTQRDTSYQRDMSRLYRGLLEWQASEAYPQKIWRVKKSLNALDAQVTQNQEITLSLNQLSAVSADRFGDFDQRIDGKQEQINRLLEQCNQLIIRQLEKLNQAAQAELAQQQNFLLALKINTSFAIARLNEKLAGES